MSNIVPKRGVTVKKALFLITLIMLMLFTLLNVNAAQIYYNDEYHDYEAENITLLVNGKQVNNLPMPPVIIDDFTMVPVREVFEALGSDVIWHDDTCQVEIADNGVSVFVKIGDRNTVVNGKTVPIDAQMPLPMLIGMDADVLKSMVPVRFIAEELGFKVDWENSTRTVYIDREQEEEIIGGIVDEEYIIPEEYGSFGTVRVESDDTYDYVYIGTKYGISPRVTRYQNPERIVFDFEGAAFTTLGGQKTLGGHSIETVRYSNHEDSARLVLDISDSTQVAVLSSEQGILIRGLKSDNDNLIYDAFQERVYFINRTYVGNGKSIENGYKVTFTNISLDNQKISINDGKIYEIIIANSPSGCTITVDGSNKLTYTAEKGFFKSDSPIKDEPPVINSGGDKVVVIDAGHGGSDPGAVGYNSSGKAVAYESHINLAIALIVGDILEENGVDVIYTRDTDTYISLQERSDIANNSECDMFVSIHCNSIESASIQGTQVYYHPSSEIGTILAENIYENVLDMTGLSPKFTQNGSHLFVIRTTTSPAVLVETAFISNESDRNYLLSKSGQKTLGEAIAQGILETLEN